MKKLLAILSICLAGSLANAQPYGEKEYQHTNTHLSSGVLTNIWNNGYLMAGYQPVALVTNQNFYIDQTNTQGLIGPTGTFSKGYTISKGNLPCSGSMVRILNCHGVTVIETPSFPSPPNNEAYAVAGTYEDVNGEAGIFFSCLTNNGTPITPAYYEFPNAGPYTDISKPLLALAPNFGTPAILIFTSVEVIAMQLEWNTCMY